MNAWKRMKHRLRKWLLHRLREFTSEEKLLAQYRLGYEHARQELAPAPFVSAQLSPAELEDIRQDHLKRDAPIIPAPRGQYFQEHRKEYTIPLQETQRLPVEQVRRLTRMLDPQEYARRMQAEQEMRRHGSIE